MECLPAGFYITTVETGGTIIGHKLERSADALKNHRTTITLPACTSPPQPGSHFQSNRPGCTSATLTWCWLWPCRRSFAITRPSARTRLRQPSELLRLTMVSWSLESRWVPFRFLPFGGIAPTARAGGLIFSWRSVLMFLQCHEEVQPQTWLP
jgi:hypothetical protein